MPDVPGAQLITGKPPLGTFPFGIARRPWTTVFSPEAAFVETPFSAPLRGIEAIRSYWIETPYYQSEATFSSGEIYAAGPWFSTEFKCVFRRRRTGEWVDARGAIFCETDGALVSEMRMYWHRHP